MLEGAELASGARVLDGRAARGFGERARRGSADGARRGQQSAAGIGRRGYTPIPWLRCADLEIARPTGRAQLEHVPTGLVGRPRRIVAGGRRGSAGRAPYKRCVTTAAACSGCGRAPGTRSSSAPARHWASSWSASCCSCGAPSPWASRGTWTCARSSSARTKRRGSRSTTAPSPGTRSRVDWTLEDLQARFGRALVRPGRVPAARGGRAPDRLLLDEGAPRRRPAHGRDLRDRGRPGRRGAGPWSGAHARGARPPPRARGSASGCSTSTARNVAGRRLYDRLGFAMHHVDRSYTLAGALAVSRSATRFDVTRDELGAILAGQPRYRLDQVWAGLYEQLASPAELTVLPKALRAELDEALPLALERRSRSRPATRARR